MSARRVERRPGVIELVLDGELDDLSTTERSERLRRLADDALRDARRVELLVSARDARTKNAAARAGFRQEGVHRAAFGDDDAVVMARLASDADLVDPEAFTHVLNSTLPRKRLIAQGLVRDGSGRILLCELTYKRFWDLPGGVVDPDEPPATTVRREIAEELSLEAKIGRLAAVSWLPRWLGWDDATLFVFEAELPAGTENAELLPREIKAVHWVEPAQVEQYVAPYTAAVVRASCAALDADSGAAYLENGHAPGEGHAPTETE